MFTRSQRFYVALLWLILSASVFEANAQTQIQGARDNPQVYSGVVYGPIDQNDTLWRIASRYKQDSQFTVYQTMLAIYELNPQAFENGNFNTMVNGAILQLPSDRYIARVDHQQARAKADADDRALGRNSNIVDSPSNEQANNSESQSSNLKPVVPLVNQEDLSKTSSQLQSQLNSLKQQQQQQFEQLKNQVATSINSVEVLLQENKKLNDQLLKIDENNRNLTQQVETELQTQINTQVDQLNQLIAIVKDAEQRRIDKESQSILQLLSTPLALIIIMSSVTLLLIIGLALFLLRKSAPETLVESTSNEPADIVDDDLVIGEVDESLDQDSEDLMAALSQEDDLEEDDILSDALEDDDNIKILSDDDMEAELEGLDDMLVPDSPSDLGDSENIDESLDFDEASLGPSEELKSNTDTIEDQASSKSTEVDNSDSDGTPSGIELDENGDIDENTIDQISNQIEEKDQAITKMTDELLEELDKEPNENNLDASKDDEANVTAPPELADSSLDALSDENDGDELDSKSVEELDELLDSIDDVNDDDAPQVTDDDLDKLIDLGGEDDVHISVNDQEDDQVSALTDELLEELESDNFEADELENLLDEMENSEVSSEQEEVFLEESSLDSTDDNNSSEASSNSREVEPILDADDLLDNIPSFTTNALEDESNTANEAEEDIKNVSSDEVNSESKTPAEKVSVDNSEDLKDESDEDVLSGLQGLDNWLDEEDDTQLKDSSKTAQDDELDFSALELDIEDIDSLSNTNSDEDNLISELEGADFDDMLNELGDDSSADQSSSDSSQKLEKAKLPANNDPIEDAGLDLDALMTSVDSDDEVKKTEKTESDGFVDVDDLLMESEAMAKPSDDDMALDLDSSLDKLMTNEDRSQDVQSDPSDAESNQSSNLDLALVYIDMEDFVAAKELLEEVTRLGTQEQQDEAKTLLSQIKS
jgi:pilus assembly protein FimV